MKKNKKIFIVVAIVAFSLLIAGVEYYEHNPRTAHARGSLQTVKKYKWGDVTVYKSCIEGYSYTSFSGLGVGGITQDFEIKTRTRYHSNTSQIVEWAEEYSVPVRCN